jgi:hypothetical protein
MDTKPPESVFQEKRATLRIAPGARTEKRSPDLDRYGRLSRPEKGGGPKLYECFRTLEVVGR